jgi:hypothetical protein
MIRLVLPEARARGSVVAVNPRASSLNQARQRTRLIAANWKLGSRSGPADPVADDLNHPLADEVVLLGVAGADDQGQHLAGRDVVSHSASRFCVLE